jgi:hypothetical protein
VKQTFGNNILASQIMMGKVTRRLTKADTQGFAMLDFLQVVTANAFDQALKYISASSL